MNSIKKLYLIVVIMAMSGVCAFAQTNGMRIVTGHPDFKIKITRCEASGNTLIIDMIFENVGSQDVRIGMESGGGQIRSSIVYDDEGNSYTGEGAIGVQFGNNPMKGYGSGPGSYGTIWDILPSQIPVKARMQIANIPESVQTLKRIDLSIICDAWGLVPDKKVRITNVPISREGDE